jgi:hypothetical protein
VILMVVMVCIWAADLKGLEEPDVPVGPPQPYSFSYTAGRYPGHVDRTHSETSDGSGTIRGKYSTAAYYVTCVEERLHMFSL